jgi:hypothetical protein
MTIWVEACTHRDPRVLVQDDLEQMWRENGWCFKTLFWFGDIGFLMVGSRWGTGEFRHIGALLGIHH